MTRRSALVLVALMAGALAAPGCMTGIKEGVYYARGGVGSVVPVRPVAPDKEARPLGAYKRFELGSITDACGGNVPQELWDHLPEEFQKAIQKEKLPDDPGGKTLLIRGKILHYESADTMSFAMGPLEEVVARLELVDKDSGKVLGEANCIGRTKGRLITGVERKAQGLARAIVIWIDKRYPEEGRRKE